MSDKSQQELEQENKALRAKLEAIEEANKASKARHWWMGKKAASAWAGKGLTDAVKKSFSEFSENKTISKDTVAELVSHVFFRFTRIGIFLVFLALLPTCILFVQTLILSSQNKRVDTQNELVGNQNTLIENQNYLLEADRRSSLVFLLSDVLDAIDKELKEDYGKDSIRNLSPQLIGRIISLSLVFKPYQYLEKDSLTRPLSPERGQLLISLMESDLDYWSTLPKIFKRANFEYADLSGANFENASLGSHDLRKLNGVNLSNANLRGANLTAAVLVGAVLRNVDFKGANLTAVLFIGSDLTGAYFGDAELVLADFNSANLTKANFKDANLVGLELGDAITKKKTLESIFGKEIPDFKNKYYIDTINVKLGLIDHRLDTSYLIKVKKEPK